MTLPFVFVDMTLRQQGIDLMESLVVAKDWGTEPIYIKQFKGKQILTIHNSLGGLPEYEIDPDETYTLKMV